MKKMLFTLVTMLTIAASANAMSYEQARNEALFLTDKMAYELNLTDAQYEAAYEINLDYLMGVTGYNDVSGIYWERRNLDLSYILYQWQWEAFRAATYFYRPLYWEAGNWHFGIYLRYPHRNYFYFGRPHFYATYRGGHSWRLNGGRSYYESRHHHFRPSIAREHHVGMRNGWDRGDYRNNHGRSSTRITGSTRDHRTDNYRNSDRRTDNYRNSDRNTNSFRNNDRNTNTYRNSDRSSGYNSNRNSGRSDRNFGGSTRSHGDSNTNRSSATNGSRSGGGRR